MNLFSLINKGVASSGAAAILSRPKAPERQLARSLTQTRAQWRNALLVDETAAWMSTYQQDERVLTGLVTVLTLCAMAREHDDGHSESAEVRVIRGAISAATQAAGQRFLITPDTVKAMSVAATRARQIVDTCSDAGIAQACRDMQDIARTSEALQHLTQRS